MPLIRPASRIRYDGPWCVFEGAERVGGWSSLKPLQESPGGPARIPEHQPARIYGRISGIDLGIMRERESACPIGRGVPDGAKLEKLIRPFMACAA
jgi:hypothetical protein